MVSMFFVLLAKALVFILFSLMLFIGVDNLVRSRR